MLCFFVNLITTFLISFYLKDFLQYYLKNSLIAEGGVRKYLASWFNLKNIRPVYFNKDEFYAFIKKIRSFDLFKVFNDNFIKLLDSFSLVLPFYVFYNFYLQSVIDFGQFMQVINLWSQIIFAFKLIEEGVENYYEYKTSYNRVNFEKYNNIVSDCINFKNVSISYDRKIVENFNLKCVKGQKYNVFGKPGVGKTSLMRAAQGLVNFSGVIEVPESIIYIPEHYTVPDKVEFGKSKSFIKNCKVMHVDPELKFHNASATQKWRLISAYALCFDFVVWDDPFFAEKDPASFDRLFSNLKSCIIFSNAESIKGFLSISID